MIFEFEDENLNSEKVKEMDIYVPTEENIYLEALNQIKIFPFCDIEIKNDQKESKHFFSFNSENFPDKLKDTDLYGDYIIICRELLSDYETDNFRKVVIDVKYYPRKFLFLVYSICYFKQIDGTIIIEEVKISDPIYSLFSAINHMEDYLERYVNDVNLVAPNKKNAVGGFYRKKYSSNKLFFKKYGLRDIARTYSKKEAENYSMFDFSEMVRVESDGEKIEIFHWNFIFGKSGKSKLQFHQIRKALNIGIPFVFIGKILGNKFYIYDVSSVANEQLKTKKEKIEYLEVFDFPSNLVESRLVEFSDLVSDKIKEE